MKMPFALLVAVPVFALSAAHAQDRESLSLRCNLADFDLAAPIPNGPGGFNAVNGTFTLKKGEIQNFATYKNVKYTVQLNQFTQGLSLTARDATSDKVMANAFAYFEKEVPTLELITGDTQLSCGELK